jgi:hypothetical protein
LDWIGYIGRFGFGKKTGIEANLYEPIWTCAPTG